MQSRDYKRTNMVPRIFETRRNKSAALTRSKKEPSFNRQAFKVTLHLWGMLQGEMNQFKAVEAALRVFLHLTKTVCAMCQLNSQGRGRA